MESSVHREVQALFGGGTVETCHGDMVRRHFPTLQKKQSVPDTTWTSVRLVPEQSLRG